MRIIDGAMRMAEQLKQLINNRTGTVVAETIDEAKGPWKAFKGLMLRKTMPDSYGMVFRPARGIHTHFMRYPIDLVFLDKTDTVVKVRPAMAPWRMDFTNADAVIEMNAGIAAAKDIRPGDKLNFIAP